MSTTTTATIKLCAKCGREHTATTWLSLAYVGEMRVEADDEGPTESIELRNCNCGSTLGLATPA